MDAHKKEEKYMDAAERGTKQATGTEPGAGPIEFNGIQLNTHYFWHKIKYIYYV